MLKLVKSFNRLVDNYLSGALLKKIKPVEIINSEYIFIFNHVRGRFVDKLYPLISYELSKRGVASCFLDKNDMLSPYYPSFFIDGYEISNSLTVEQKRYVKSKHGQQLFFDWMVEIENKKIEAEGINFFYIIRNTLRAIQKRYNVYFFDENNQPVYMELIQSCDVLVKYFLLLKEFANKNNKKIRFVGWEISYVPTGILKLLCNELSHNRDVEFIELERGYMSYFGQHHIKDSYISCCNLTHTKSPFGWVIAKEELDKIDTNNIESDKLLKPISNAIGKNIYHEIPEKQKDVIKQMEEYKSQGKKIFVLFAHLFYDTPIDDESNAFDGMCEWIQETVEYFNRKEHILIIKPHPSEFREELPKKTPNETLASFLSDTGLSANIILLQPRLFSVKDLSPFITCGLIWRSSVAMELTFLDIPCIIAGNPVYNALDLNIAKNKEHYYEMIEKSHEIKSTEKLKFDIAKYLYLLEKKHFLIECISYDWRLKRFYWDRKSMMKYLKMGNKNINAIVENILI